MTIRFDRTHHLDQAHQAGTSFSEDAFAPANLLEKALVEAEAGRLNHRDFINIFVHSEVYQITDTAPQSEENLCFPMSFQDPEQGRMVAVFSAPIRTRPFQKQAPHLLPLKGSQVFETVPAGFGVVLNPGAAVGLTIPGYGVLQIRRDFGIARV